MKKALKKGNFKSKYQQDQRTPNLNHAISVEKDLHPNIRPNVKPGEQYVRTAQNRDLSLNAVTPGKLSISSNRSQMKKNATSQIQTAKKVTQS